MTIAAATLATYLAVATGATGLVAGLYDLGKQLYGDVDRRRSGRNRIESGENRIEPDKIGHICDQLYLYRNSLSMQRSVLRRYSKEIVEQTSAIRERLSLYDPKLAKDLYENVIEQAVISPSKESSNKYKKMDSRRTAALASIIALASLSLTYFTLFPEKPTAHTIIPMSLNVVGIFLSFVLLSLGAWLVMKKIN